MTLFESETPKRISVLLPLPFEGPFDYFGLADRELPPGTLVEVPLGPRLVRGVVWDKEPAGDVADEKLKAVEGVLPLPPFPDDLMKLVEWIAGYTLTPLGSVLRLAMAVPTRWKPQKAVPYYKIGANDPPRMTPARARVLDFMRDAPPLTKKEIAEIAGVTPSVIAGLVEAGAVEEAPRGAPSIPRVTGDEPMLRPDQAKAADALTAKVKAGEATVTLLDGVTGSGKTETYMEAVAKAVEEGGQVLILLPEIALTAQLLDRFAKRLGFAPEPWHSDRTPAKRRAAYQKIAKGEAPVVVGARSALFLPFPNLKLIVVDEEHETAFRQDDGTLYHGRDMAVVRGHLGKFPVVLASATPSLETVMNVEWGRYDKVVLEGRHGTAGLPEITAIDMRAEGPDSGSFLSPPLMQAMVETLGRGEQVLLYLNRRGFAPLTLCRACGHRFQCPHCTAWLVEHRFKRKLQCHHCGYQVPVPKQCPSCEAEDKLVPIGPGVERVAEEVMSYFPEARLGVLSSDFLLREAVQKQKGGQRPSLTALAREKVAQFADGQLDILVGTQIVAKGHHFPKLTLVGVVDADMGLAGADPRAAERSFQMLTQVAGRAGREATQGHVLVQTYDPDHPVIAALVKGNRDEFMAVEAKDREMVGLPPFGRMAALILSGADRREVEAVGRAIRAAAPPNSMDLMVLGPAEAPLAMIRGQHRQRLLIKGKRTTTLQPLIRGWLDAVKVPSSVRVSIDIDPISFL